jgi:predicted PurR-regulated permease PerM
MELRPVRIVNLIPAVLIAFGIYVLWGAISTLGQPLLLIVLAMIIAAGLNPIVVWANARLRMPRALAAAIILFAVFGGFGLLIWSLVPTIVAQLSNLISSIPNSVTQLQKTIEDLSSRYSFLKSAADGLSSANLAGQLQTALSAIPRTLLTAVGATTGVLNGLLLGLLLLIMGFAVLVQPEPLIKGAISGVPPAFRNAVSRATTRIGKQLGAWLIATLVTSVVMSLLVAIALWALTLFGIPVQSIFLFAVIAGVTQIIPVIGGLIGLVPPVLASLSPNPANALWVGIVIFAVQQVVFQGLTPIILSRSVNLHQASLLAGVLLFSALFGFVGAFLAVPFLIIIKALYEDIYLPSLGGTAVTDAQVQDMLEGELPPVPAPASTQPKTE